jgi:hypothetical protein
MIYQIPSKSQAGVIHKVEFINDYWTCDCIGFINNDGINCRHIEIAKQERAGTFKDKIVFIANNPLIKQFSLGGLRVQLEVPESEWDKIKDLYHWREGMNLKITIEKV